MPEELSHIIKRQKEQIQQMDMKIQELEHRVSTNEKAYKLFGDYMKGVKKGCVINFIISVLTFVGVVILLGSQ